MGSLVPVSWQKFRQNFQGHQSCISIIAKFSYSMPIACQTIWKIHLLGRKIDLKKETFSLWQKKHLLPMWWTWYKLWMLQRKPFNNGNCKAYRECQRWSCEESNSLPSHNPGFLAIVCKECWNFKSVYQLLQRVPRHELESLHPSTTHSCNFTTNDMHIGVTSVISRTFRNVE